jgi:two-component system sensor histidine kinase KdpD
MQSERSDTFMKAKKIMKDLLLSIGIFLVAIALSIVFQTLDVGEHITTIFVFAVFLISLLTEGYSYGILSAIGSMLAVNYVFTFPYFAFDFILPVNLISAIIMTSVSVVTGMLTTKIKRYEAEKAEIERERMRANLLRAVSHDLRTPLTAIYGASSTLRNKKKMLTEQQQDAMLKNIEQDSEWLIRMVENLLSVTRINSEQISITKTPVILDELVDSVMTKFLNRYPRQNVVIDVPDEVVVVSIDTILMEQVLMNLLENAVLHAENMTHISLHIFALGSKVVFEIADDGCGIREDKLKHLFSGTYHAQETSADTKKRNIGIGLSVCETIIKAHNGEITAGNRKSGGAVFRFTLDKEDTVDDEQ